MPWFSGFDEAIPLPRGRTLVTLKDAGNYITKLPKAEHEAPEWQAAFQRMRLVQTHTPSVDRNSPERLELEITENGRCNGSHV
jgi:hypothetical protein